MKLLNQPEPDRAQHERSEGLFLVARQREDVRVLRRLTRARRGELASGRQ